MSKSVRFQVEDKAPAAAGPGFKPDTGFRPVDLSHPKLDCSEVGLDGDQELWLMQLPHDFPVGASVEWQISPNPADGFRGNCMVKGVEYVLVPEAEALSAELFATPASERGSLVPITRRMTVARCTMAPMTCFGQQEMEDLAVPKVVDLLTLDKQAPITKKKGKQTREQAAVAPKVAEPRGGAAPATASKAGEATAAVGNQQRQQQQQQQQQGQQQEQHDAEPSKPKKDKSAKKAKKRQDEAATPSVAPAAAGQDVAPAAAAEDASKSSSKKAKKRQAEEAATGAVPAAAAATQVADKSSSKSGKKRKSVAAEQEVVAAVTAVAPAVTPTAATPLAGVAKEQKPSSKKKKEKKEKKESQRAA
ncbi:hypothetical protein D9Q98_001382 [Chlorella vulgaris]|uniref:Uncharacterized protein n=1 Tax=Chlorella vulgaris TaxID=3077 RepID=A0A9D4Z211_CHLVU|nr:hypothetical protein D9Q98_001382 [Chlorella vulgaris]